MLVSVNYEVIGRSFFGHATIWVTEVSTYLVVIITFIGAAFVASRDGNVRVDLVLKLFSEQRQIEIKNSLTWIAIFVALVALWKVTGFWKENFDSGARSWSLLNTPLWIPQLSAVIGLAALVLAMTFNETAKFGVFAALPVLAAMVLAMIDGTGLLSFGLSPSTSILCLGVLTIISAGLAGGVRALIVVGIVVIPVVILFILTNDAGLSVKSMALIAVLFFLLFSGLPVVFCLFAIGIFAMIFWLPPVTLNYIGERSWEAVNTFEFAAIPMFVLMGSILVRSNASSEMFEAARLGMGRIRGSLAHASIFASGIFAAVSGSSIATAATMGRVAGPEMIRAGYKPELAYGVLAAGGTLGILIPPSIAMIVYGPLADIPASLIRDTVAPLISSEQLWWSGGAGLCSTVANYMRFARMLLNGGSLDSTQILRPETLALMCQDYLPENVGYGTYTAALGITAPWPENGLGFGLGFAVGTQVTEHLPGGIGEVLWPGVSGANFWVDPENDLIVVFLTHAPDHRATHRIELRNAIYAGLKEET
ncbi:TRAP transporter large permease subunit [Yoonia sp. MH D7]